MNDIKGRRYENSRAKRRCREKKMLLADARAFTSRNKVKPSDSMTIGPRIEKKEGIIRNLKK